MSFFLAGTIPRLSDWLMTALTNQAFIITPNLTSRSDQTFETMGIPCLHRGPLTILHIPKSQCHKLVAHLIFEAYCDNPGIYELDSFPIPKIGTATPKLLQIDIPEGVIDPRTSGLLEKGLGFVPNPLDRLKNSSQSPDGLLTSSATPWHT